MRQSEGLQEGLLGGFLGSFICGVRSKVAIGKTDIRGLITILIATR